MAGSGTKTVEEGSMKGSQELARLISDSRKDKKLVSHFALLGHDTGSFVRVANNLGYHFTDADVNAHVAQKVASVTKKASQPTSAVVTTIVTGVSVIGVVTTTTTTTGIVTGVSLNTVAVADSVTVSVLATGIVVVT
jgi:hypothetical protein